MISYWKSNAKKEFGFYGQGKEKKLNDNELNEKIIEALAEPDDIDDEEEEQENNNQRRTTSGEIIPNNNVIVLIEKLWIEKDIDLTNQLILENIGKIPQEEDDFVMEENPKENENNNNINIEKGILDYNIDDLVNEYTIL